jgi:signal peptidase I
MGYPGRDFMAKADKSGKKGRETRKKSLLREYLEAAAIAIVLALFIRAFVVQAFKIPSGSMEPTLLIGDHILVNKFLYGIKAPFINKTIIPITNPERGDIIVFIYPLDRKKDFIKRVIGLPGDEIRIVNNRIYINGKAYDDPYGVYGDNTRENKNLGPFMVPEGSLFVMGDNRDHSYDSRYWGFVPMESVKGKAMIIYWSWPHWKRFGHIIR